MMGQMFAEHQRSDVVGNRDQFKLSEEEIIPKEKVQNHTK